MGGADRRVELVGGQVGGISSRKLWLAVPEIPAALRPVARSTAFRLEPAVGNGTVWTDDKAPVEWLVDLSLIGYANE